jgi:aromatic-L-amino-acid decarboxylase
MNLDIDHLEEYLAAVCDLIVDYRERLAEDPVVPQIDYPHLFEQIHHTLPRTATPIEEVLEDVEQTIIPFCTKVGHPRFLAWMNNSSSAAGILGEILNVGLSQVPFMYKGGPAATVLEDIVVQWYGQLFGFPEGHGGTLVSGGMVANLTALTVAREIHGDMIMRKGLQGSHAPLTLYISEQGHSSIERAVGILGLGIDHIRKIPTDSSFKMQVDALRHQLDQDIAAGCRPFCVVAQAGAANTGVIDPLPEVAQICADYHLWMHVDAAYGGGAILTSTGKEKLKGIELADSITTDPHKWFFMPVEAGLILIRDRESLYRTFNGSACQSYKGPLDDQNYLNFGIQYARTSRALKIWFALRVYGLERISACVEQTLILAQQLKARLESSACWEILHPVELSILCCRYIPQTGTYDDEVLNSLQYAIVEKLETSGKALLTPAVINGKVGIRICFANHKTTAEDVDILFDALMQTAETLGHFVR